MPHYWWQRLSWEQTHTALWQEIELFQRVTGWELPCATSVSTPLDCVNPLAFKQSGKGQGEMEKGLCQCSAARNFSPVWVSRWTDTVVSSVCWTHQYNSECLYCLHTVDWLEKTVVKKQRLQLFSLFFFTFLYFSLFFFTL